MEPLRGRFALSFASTGGGDVTGCFESAVAIQFCVDDDGNNADEQ